MLLKRGSRSRSSYISDLKLGTAVTKLPATFTLVRAQTDLPGVSVLYCVLVKPEILICNFCLNMAARILVWVHPSLRYISMLLGR